MKNKNKFINKLIAAVAFFSLTGMDFMPTLMAQQELQLTSMCSDEPAVSRRWRVRNHTAAPINYTWDVVGTSQTGGGVASPGDNFFFTSTVSGPNTTRVFWSIGENNFSTVKASGGAQCEQTPPPTPQGCFASQVVGFSQGLTKLGTPVNPERSIPENALGAPDGQNPVVNAPVQNFYSLGFGGSITLAFPHPIANGEGADIKIWESSASPNAERARISVSQNGIDFVEVGEVSMTGTVDFGAAFSDYVLFVKITDISNPAQFGNNQVSDGYDVDAVECLHGEFIIPQGCFAIEVVDFNQKKRNDGSSVLASRSNPEKALGEPQNSDAPTSEANVNFVSLGFGGSITLKMSGPIKNGPGNDFRVVETTFGSMSGNCNRYPERIQAFASQDGCNWVYVGEGCQDVDLDLGILDWALYIKLVDISPIGAAFNGDIADGYDVDGIICLNGFEENPVLQDLGADYAMSVVDFSQGLRKNGTAVVANRSNPAQALGAPEGTDVINFVSLGFGGSITLKLGYVVFDKDGDDLQIVETSFGNPACASYPERALIEVSLDGINFTELGEVCLDGAVDFAVAGVTAAQYIRITDRSNATQFGGSADGYDVDGVVVLQPGCAAPADSRVIADNINTPDETASFSVFPNPFQNVVTLEVLAGDAAEQMIVRVMNIAGQNVLTTNVNVAANSRINHTMDLSDLPNGVYLISVDTNNGREVHKLIKQ
jgi:hypothetical protein